MLGWKTISFLGLSNWSELNSDIKKLQGVGSHEIWKNDYTPL